MSPTRINIAPQHVWNGTDCSSATDRRFCTKKFDALITHTPHFPPETTRTDFRRAHLQLTMFTFVPSFPLLLDRHRQSNQCQAHNWERPRWTRSLRMSIDSAGNGQAPSVREVLHRRYASDSKPGARTDDHKVALCIEGGGMRGAISAGMTAAIRYSGLSDAFDEVYGCSAGAIAGAYFVSNQLPTFAARIYYDALCSPWEDGTFIDLGAFRYHPYVRQVGIGSKDDASRPVLHLDRLIDRVMRETAPLDWESFATRHARQPLIPVATSLTLRRSHAFRDISSLDGLLERLRASARVVGIAGDAVGIEDDIYADALLFEPIPYRSAIANGATHVVVLRSRGRSSYVPRRSGAYEWLIAPPYLARTQGLTEWRDMARYLRKGGHIKVYREDVANLQLAQWNGAEILQVLPDEDGSQVGQLERKARVVFNGVRSGFAAGYDALSPMGGFAVKADEATAGSRVARLVFPDEEINLIEQEHMEQRRRRKTRLPSAVHASFESGLWR